MTPALSQALRSFQEASVDLCAADMEQAQRLLAPLVQQIERIKAAHWHTNGARKAMTGFDGRADDFLGDTLRAVIQAAVDEADDHGQDLVA